MTDIADLVAKLDALYFDAKVKLGTPDYRDFMIQVTTDYPELRRIVVAAKELTGFVPWVHGEETDSPNECWACGGWRMHIAGCSWQNLVSAVRGEA